MKSFPIQPIEFNRSSQSDMYTYNKLTEANLKPDLCSHYSKIYQHTILYYSDFDIDVTDWKIELERLKIFSCNLFQVLSKTFIKEENESWIDAIKYIIICDTNKVRAIKIKQSIWEIIIEYAVLTMESEKDIKVRAKEVQNYIAFYGYKVINEERFRELIIIFIEQSTKMQKVIKEIEKIDENFRAQQKESIYKEIKEYYEKYPYSTSRIKKHKIHHNIFNRQITFLLSAQEHLLDSSESDLSSETLSSQLEKLY